MLGVIIFRLGYGGLISKERLMLKEDGYGNT